MLGVFSPVLQSNDPVTPVAVNTELLQLFTTSTIGAFKAETVGAAATLPGGPVQPFTICATE